MEDGFREPVEDRFGEAARGALVRAGTAAPSGWSPMLPADAGVERPTLGPEIGRNPRFERRSGVVSLMTG